MPLFAKKIDFPKNWNDQVISLQVRENIKVIESNLIQSKLLSQKSDHLNKRQKGIKILFDGPSKKEKINAVMLLSKSIGKDLYRIDLNSVISKYIGETEKNFRNLFDKAANKDWILFFDEADALFGKRTNIKDAHDRFENADILYLLQKIEEYNGVVILASNSKESINTAFLKRFEFIIHFNEL